MDEKGIEKRIRAIEQDIDSMRKALNIIAEENNILKMDSTNIVIERMKLKKEREKIYDDWIKRLKEYETCLDEEYSKIESMVCDIKENCENLYEENQALISEKSKGLLKEILKQARLLKEKTGDNPFESLK